MPTITANDTSPTRSVAPSVSLSPPNQSPNFRQAFSPLASVPVSLGSSPMTTSIAAPKRKPVMTAFDRKWEIQPILRRASTRKSRPVTRVIAATSSTASSSATEARATALPATAARAELGPVAICLQVPNSAYNNAPVAAAKRPCWIGTPAMPA